MMESSTIEIHSVLLKENDSNLYQVLRPPKLTTHLKFIRHTYIATDIYVSMFSLEIGCQVVG